MHTLELHSVRQRHLLYNHTIDRFHDVCWKSPAVLPFEAHESLSPGDAAPCLQQQNWTFAAVRIRLDHLVLCYHPVLRINEPVQRYAIRQQLVNAYCCCRAPQVASQVRRACPPPPQSCRKNATSGVQIIDLGKFVFASLLAFFLNQAQVSRYKYLVAHLLHQPHWLDLFACHLASRVF